MSTTRHSTFKQGDNTASAAWPADSANASAIGSSWITVDQPASTNSRTAPEDHQWIHVDVERAREGKPVRRHHRPRLPDLVAARADRLRCAARAHAAQAGGELRPGQGALHGARCAPASACATTSSVVSVEDKGNGRVSAHHREHDRDRRRGQAGAGRRFPGHADEPDTDRTRGDKNGHRVPAQSTAAAKQPQTRAKKTPRRGRVAASATRPASGRGAASASTDTGSAAMTVATELGDLVARGEREHAGDRTRSSGCGRRLRGGRQVAAQGDEHGSPGKTAGRYGQYLKELAPDRARQIRAGAGPQGPALRRSGLERQLAVQAPDADLPADAERVDEPDRRLQARQARQGPGAVLRSARDRRAGAEQLAAGQSRRGAQGRRHRRRKPREGPEEPGARHAAQPA